MISVVILGAGNVGLQLARAIYSVVDCELIQVYNRSEVEPSVLPEKVPFTSDLSALYKADVYLLAIPDDAILGFSSKLPFKGQLVAHTSGSAALEAIDKKNRGAVFYPLQTFSKESTPDFRSIPICIESRSQSDLETLKKLASSLSDTMVVLNSEERVKLHLAAVLVNNFSNHLYKAAADFLEENSLDFSLLRPLIGETANKIYTLSPEDAQTGPARRGDLDTIKKHLALLEESPYRELYQKLTESIQESYGKKL